VLQERRRPLAQRFVDRRLPDDDGHRYAGRRAHGELDLSTGEEIAARIGEALMSAEVDRIAIDLAEVTFLDCYTIGVLLRGQRVAAAHAVRM
jgi:anti-sigma B factor antagonist